jgi:hypothetical protein
MLYERRLRPILATDAPSFEVYFSNHCTAGQFTRIQPWCMLRSSLLRVPKGAWMEEAAFGGYVHMLSTTMKADGRLSHELIDKAIRKILKNTNRQS